MACQFLRLFLVGQSAAEGTSSLKSCAEWSHFVSCNFRVFAVVGGYERHGSLFLSLSASPRVTGSPEAAAKFPENRPNA